jgi:isoleucyl-tRNA synthetase
MLLTSEARVGDSAAAPADAESIKTEFGSLAMLVTPTEHEKCVRCWHYRADVGSSPDHPEICGRCVENISGSGEIRRIG